MSCRVVDVSSLPHIVHGVHNPSMNLMNLLPWAKEPSLSDKAWSTLQYPFTFVKEPSLFDKAWMTLRWPYDIVRSPIQAIASVPALSFLVIPAFSSYGTSINLLFFYMTWAILIRSNDPLHVEFLGTLGVRILFYILPSLGFLVFDSATPNLAVNIKEHGESALPMGEEQGGRNGRWWKITLVSIGNVMLGVAIQMSLETLFTQVLHMRSLLKVSVYVPMPWSIAKDLVMGLLLREVLTYILHRYVLHSRMSPRLRKLHSSWQHSLPAPFSLVAHYDHPLTYLIHTFIPMYLPAILFRFHLLTYHLYLILISIEETFAYSGYNVLPSAFILGGIARRQEKHLMEGGHGNYGCFGLMDFCMGTSLGTDLADDMIDEAEDKQVARKAKGKLKRAGNRVRSTRKKIQYEDEGEDEEEEEESTEAEEEDEERPRRRRNGNKSSDDYEEEAKGKTPKRKLGRRKKSDEDNEAEDAAESEKPRSKPRKLERRGSQKKKA